MVLDCISNCSLYEGMHPLFKKAFEFLKNTDLQLADPGKYELEGSDLFVSLVDIQGKQPSEAKMESHDRYIDIQYIVRGCEQMGYTPRCECREELTPYSEAKDITFYKDPARVMLHLCEGQFAIFFPGDGHAPAIGDGSIRKAIVKVRV